MTSSEVLATIWRDLSTPHPKGDVHAMTCNAVEAVLKESINRRTLDNITVVIIAFQADAPPDRSDRPKTAASIERRDCITTASRDDLGKQALLRRSM